MTRAGRKSRLGRMISGSVGRPWAASQVLVARRVRSGRPVSQSTSWSAASSLTSATPSGSGGSSVGGGEEPVPLPGLALDEVQPVAHVGDDAVDVDDGERSGVHGRSLPGGVNVGAAPPRVASGPKTGTVKSVEHVSRPAQRVFDPHALELP